MLWLDAACEMRGVSLVILFAAVAADGFCLCDGNPVLLSEASSNWIVNADGGDETVVTEAIVSARGQGVTAGSAVPRSYHILRYHRAFCRRRPSWAICGREIV